MHFGAFLFFVLTSCNDLLYNYVRKESDGLNMVNFKIELAEMVIEVNALYASTMQFLSDYTTEKEADFSLIINKNDIEYEREKSREEDILQNIPVRRFSDEYLETLALYRKIATKAIDCGVILFHGSAVAVDGKCYIFTAKSGTGKSTHTRLWKSLLGEQATIINDDKPLIRIREDSIKVYGTPWNGKHKLSSNTSAELKAICLLKRGEVNRITEISEKSQCFPEIFQQIFRVNEKNAMLKTISLTEKLLENIALFEMHCNMEIDAAEMSYTAMRK